MNNLFNRRIFFRFPAIIIIVSIVLLIGCKKENTNTLPPLKDGEVATLPVIFHIVYRGESVGTGDNLSAETIRNYFDKLNANFANTTFNGNSVDAKIQFRLAVYDYNGNQLPEPGIQRISQPNYNYVADSDTHNQVILSNYWTPKQFINIWVVDTYSPTSGLNKISWTTLPVMTDNTQLCGLNHISGDGSNLIPSYADGLVLTNTVFTDDAGGTIITHEMGHYLGLLHVFQNGCAGDSDCLSDTYFYDRTTYTNNFQTTMPFKRQTCNMGIVEGDNYMDYYYQRTYRFTQQQVDRMRYVLSYSPVRSPERFSNKRTTGKQRDVIDTIGLFPNPKIEN